MCTDARRKQQTLRLATLDELLGLAAPGWCDREVLVGDTGGVDGLVGSEADTETDEGLLRLLLLDREAGAERGRGREV